MNGNGLPSGWASTRVADLAHRVTKGTTPTTLGHPYRCEGIRFVKVECLDAHRIRHDTCMFIDAEAHAALSRSQLQTGDVLISIAGTLGRVAVVHDVDVPANTNQAVAIVRPESVIVPQYLAHAFDSSLARNAVSEGGRGVGLQNLNLEQVANLPLLLAPLPEQHRIVAAIEDHFSRLDEAVALLERVQRNLKRYRASVLKAAVEGRLVPTEAALARADGRAYEPASVLLERILAERWKRWKAEVGRGTYKEPVAPDTTGLPELPEGWCWATVDQLAERPICYGVLKAGPHDPNGVPLVRVTDIVAGDLSLSALKRCNPAREAVFARARLRAGDVVVSKDGSIGFVALVPQWLDGANITQHVLRVGFAPSMSVGYAMLALRSPQCQSWMKGETRGVALQGVNVEDFRRMPVPLPPAGEQVRLADEVDRHTSIARAAERTERDSAARLARLRQSILKWAFEGRLVDQDPADEPASLLLERIRGERGTTANGRRRRA
jgi:type I restriction enzyme S subunit